MLYLLPNLLTDLPSHADQLPSSVDQAVGRLTHLIAEHEKQGRHFLRRFAFAPSKTFRDIPIFPLNEHSTELDKRELVRQMKEGGVWGLVSDCGMPCLADPGADLVLMARKEEIPIEALVGPSSIVLALVLSGLGGQRFTFHGYLPREEELLLRELKQIEQTSRREKSTHLWIETPYRNLKLLERILSVLEQKTWLSIACDLLAPTQWVQTLPVGAWKKQPLPDLSQRPTVFSIRG